MGAVLVFVGGGLGALCRYGCQLLGARFEHGYFPWATFGVNLLGSFLLGLLFGLGTAIHLRTEWRLLLATGFLGGYTTFSSWQLESWMLLTSGRWGLATWNLLGSTVAGLVCLIAGYALGERM